jgi:soluble lytic murein transglycosylase-like protein
MALVVLCLLSIPLLAAGDQSFKVRIQRVSEYYAAHYAKHYGVPVELVEAIIEVESGWNPLAQSTQGAAGLMQLMPATAARFQVKNRSNIEQNIRGGVEYLAYLYRLFEGDLRLAMAAYVAGESRVLRKKLAYASPEVLAYVSEVARIYRQKQKSN